MPPLQVGPCALEATQLAPTGQPVHVAVVHLMPSLPERDLLVDDRVLHQSALLFELVEITASVPVEQPPVVKSCAQCIVELYEEVEVNVHRRVTIVEQFQLDVVMVGDLSVDAVEEELASNPLGRASRSEESREQSQLQADLL